MTGIKVNSSWVFIIRFEINAPSLRLNDTVIFAIVTFAFAIVCLTNASEQGNCPTPDLSDDTYKLRDTNGSPEKLMEILREKLTIDSFYDIGFKSLEPG